MSRLLTKRKQAWADRRRPDLVQGYPIIPNAAVANRYYDELAKLVEDMTEETYYQIRILFDEPHAQEYFAVDASTAAQARILTNLLMRKFNSRFSKKAGPIATMFANQSDKASSSAVYSSIQKLSGGLSLPTSALKGQLEDILSATITANVGLIKSISQEYLAGVQGAVMRSITTGNGLQDLVPYLQQHKDITLRRAQLIALDQNRKAMNNLSKGRMQNLGLAKYKWQHTGGSDHPRELHVRMSGNVYRFDDPPVIDERTGERGIPGQLPFCRCRMVPVIEFD